MRDNVEIQLLCTLIAKPRLLEDISLTPDDFSTDVTKKIFRSLSMRYERGDSIDGLMMARAMASKVDQEVILDVCDSTKATPWEALTHARMVRDAALRRHLRDAAYKLLEATDKAEWIDDVVLAEIEKTVLDVGTSTAVSKGPRSIVDVMSAHELLIETRYANRGTLTGVDTGFVDLNRLTGGWQEKHLSIIAARPSVGKTAFVLQSAIAAAKTDYALVFSIEMSEETLADRLVANGGAVSLYKLTTGKILDEDWSRISIALSQLADPNLHLEIDDSPNVTVGYIRSQVRRLMRTMPEGKKLAVFIDYLQLIRDSGEKRSKYESVSEISRDLKAMAKELGCAVIALAQLSRANEQRQDKRPMMSDIRDSGQIEQDADLIAFLHRDDYYDSESERKNLIDVIVRKNRNGPIGTVQLAFAKDVQRFTNIERVAQ